LVSTQIALLPSVMFSVHAFPPSDSIFPILHGTIELLTKFFLHNNMGGPHKFAKSSYAPLLQPPHVLPSGFPHVPVSPTTPAPVIITAATKVPSVASLDFLLPLQILSQPNPRAIQQKLSFQFPFSSKRAIRQRRGNVVYKCLSSFLVTLPVGESFLSSVVVFLF